MRRSVKSILLLGMALLPAGCGAYERAREVVVQGVISAAGYSLLELESIAHAPRKSPTASIDRLVAQGAGAQPRIAGSSSVEIGTAGAARRKPKAPHDRTTLRCATEKRQGGNRSIVMLSEPSERARVVTFRKMRSGNASSVQFAAARLVPPARTSYRSLTIVRMPAVKFSRSLLLVPPLIPAPFSESSPSALADRS